MENKVGKALYEGSHKRGISLIVLLVTIVVTLIIISITVVSINNAIDDASLTTFANDLTQIQQSTESYYITNNKMPELDGYTAMNKDDIIAIARVGDILLEELTENNDLDSQFFTIDLAKINITKTAYGFKRAGENDIFVISFPTMNAYYLYGLDVGNNTYFSITSKISDAVKVTQDQLDTSVTSVVSSGGVTVTKRDGWANKMGVNIEADMEPGEELYLSVSGDTNRLITTVNGRNNFGFNLLSAVVAGTETMKVPTLTQAEAGYIEQGTKPYSERYIDILKYKNSEVIGRVRVNLSNFSLELATITSATLSSYSRMNTVKLVFANNDSGIKEIRYEYLKKYTNQGTIENYYTDITDFDSVYMKDRAKKANLASDLTTNINAPKNIQSIKVAIIDNAGNVNLYNQQIAPPLYIGHVLDNYTQDSLQITANMYSTNGIREVSFAISEDGIDFTDEQTYTLNTTISGVTTKQSLPFTGIESSRIHVKMVASNYDNTITETKITMVDLAAVQVGEGLGVDVIANENTTVNGQIAAFNNPIIPKGFKAINDGTIWPDGWNSGLVIEDVNGNQFVWVPVDGINVTYVKRNADVTYIDHTETTDDTLPVGVSSELDQVTNYGGFYIARYEAGKEGVDTLVSKKFATVWNNINYTSSKSKSDVMYNTPEVKSGLITGRQWDTTMEWLKSTGKNVSTNSTTWGNYINSTDPANVSGFGSLQVTGYSEHWKANNIYDLAGNTFEWTNEIYSDSRVNRGGFCQDSGLTFPAASRVETPIDMTFDIVSFRVVLYIQ